MTRNLRILTLALVALLVVALPASSLAKHRGKIAQASAQSVGSVSSFSGDVLSIEVADGSKITGRVVPRTFLGCSRGGRGWHFQVVGRRRCNLDTLRVGTKVLAADLSLTADGPEWRRVIFLIPAAGPSGPTGPTGPIDMGNTT